MTPPVPQLSNVQEAAEHVAAISLVSSHPIHADWPAVIQPSKHWQTVERQTGQGKADGIPTYTETVHQPTPYTIAVVGQAMQQGHRISLCPMGGGSRIHSKRRGVRCIVCKAHWDITPLGKSRHCTKCQKRLDPNRTSGRCVKCALAAMRQRLAREQGRH